ncbi:YqiJ family protein [Nitrincola sp. MINF-07-Sa-05]|uniref:YqiJ family protein n=1 Tax=Nitrincola salilacus TaxID=3400273 RepID=UPI003917CD7F
MSQLLAAENSLFTGALLLMLMIAVLEVAALLLGQGLSSALEALIPDSWLGGAEGLDGSEATGPLSKLLGWLRLGRVPLMMLLIVFLLCFGLLGLFIQARWLDLSGSLLPAWIAAPLVLVLCLPLVRGISGLIERILPRDETTAISADSLVGRIATITLGTARAGMPAQARVRDQHGYSHYVQIEPDDPSTELPQGTEVLILSRQEWLYRGITNPNQHLTD